MSASVTAVLAIRGRGGRSNAPMVEIAVPPQRASLDPVAGVLRSSTVLVVAPGHAVWAPLTAGMLDMGIGRVLRAESSAAVDAIIAQRPPGDLALVSSALGNKTGKVMRKLRAAGWHRVLALANRADRRNVGEHHHLSRHQISVLHCLARGLSVKRTARQLWITPSAVKRHVRHIGTELGTQDAADMLAVGLRADPPTARG